MSGGPANVNPHTIAIMGRLAMPSMPLTKKYVYALIQLHSPVTVVDIYFMSIVEKAALQEKNLFELIIDASIRLQ